MAEEDYRHVPLILAGTFKGEEGVKLFIQPLAARTKDGRELSKWYLRYLQSLKAEGITKGPLFRNDKGRRMTVSELDVYFISVLLEVQRKFPNAIPDSVKVEDEYSVFRLLRRGATSKAQNVGLPEPVIESNNRWRKFHRAKEMRPGWIMMQHYTDAQVAAPMLIQFSAGLPG